MRRKLSAFPAEALQHLGLLIAFVLLLAAKEFAATHPALTAILVFIFSLPYLVASVATKRPNFLYATMLLGAVSYFLTCHALGAPGVSFPLLSVPLVVCLWTVGQLLRKQLPAELGSYPPVVFRAMNITVGVFTVWTLAQAGHLLGQPGLMRYVAGFTFLGYAGLYLAYCVAGAPAVYAYVFSMFLSLGGIFTVLALGALDFCWVPTIASAAAILFIGTKFHSDRKYGWSRHFYFSSAAVIFVSLAFSMLRWPFVTLDLALGSLLLWVAYKWLSEAVDGAYRATMAERVVAKCFFSGALLLTVPIVPMMFIWPANLHVACAALICGLTFSWIAWQRRGQTSSWANIYVLAAAMFASAGLFGLGRQLPGWSALGWSLVGPLVLLTGLGLVYAFFDKARYQRARTGLAQAAIFPAFFAWFIPLLLGELAVALAGAVVTLVAVVVLGARLKERFFHCAVGPASAGILIAGTLLLAGQSLAAWVTCAVVAAAAGVWFVWAEARSRPVTRAAANLGWLILSVAAIAIAATAGPAHALYSVTAVGLTSVLIAGRPKRQEQRDVLDIFAQVLGILATVAAVALGPFSGLGPVVGGLCLLILSLAHWLAWGLGQVVKYAYAANGLLALGLLLVIFGELPAVDARLGAGAAVVLILFILGAAMRRRFPQVGHSSVLAGHLASIVLGCAALIQAWPLSTSHLPLAAGAYVLLYAVMPRLRASIGFRLGTTLWLSLTALFCLAVYNSTPYYQQIPAIALLSLMWLAAGYALKRSRVESWSIPLYICAALLAGFCSVVSLFTPAVEGSWRVFLINGMVFACLFLILRQDIFAYLITLSLSLLAYDWVKASTSSFTQDVLFYLVIGASVLGLFFLLPHIKRLLVRWGSVPMISIFTWRGAATISVPVLGLALLVLSLYSVKITEHPKFCTSCHYMGDYYTSWQHSAHREVACIQCHYEPGVAAEVKGKMEGMVQLVKYISHSYGTKPHAMISNKSCMRQGCHVDMDHSKETLLFRGQIRFRHDKHLDEQPRGKELNCVSCHGQTVKGQHITVSETTCLTCHFYGRKQAAVAAGECLTCHRMPEKTVEFMGQSFDHREFLKGKRSVRCASCHSQVTQGDGAISPTRCQSCHRQSPEKIEDQAQFHLVHVSQGHFDCLQCHDEIKHGIHPMEQQLLASGNCHSCHEGERHSLQERIYAGTALPEVERIPDAMYKAGVACDGCHTQVQSAGVGGMSFTKKLSGPKQCADCHGSEMYAQMLASWQEDTKERIAELEPTLKQLDETCRTAQMPAEELAKAQKLLNSAKTKLSYVMKDGSYGAHNIAYVSAILDSVEAEIESCRSLTAAWDKVGPEESRR